MFFGLVPLIYRERRRLAFVVSMAFLAGFLFYLRANFYVYGVHIAIITGAVYAGVVGICTLLICRFLPAMRFMIEAVAVSRLALSFFVLFVPNIGYRILADPFVTALLVVIGGAILSRLMHGRILREKAQGWRDRILPRNAFQRVPVRVHANAWQYRFVGWVDGAVPIRVAA